MLLFVAQRIVRVSTILDVWRRSGAEFALIVATMLAILVLPIQQGVGIGIILSLMHGVWTTTRARIVEFERIPGTSIWWPASALERGETVPGVRVVGLQAPLSFLNAYAFQQAIQALPESGTRLLVVEANAIVEIDYTGAKVLGDVVERLRAGGVDVAFARLESVRAQESFARQGLRGAGGPRPPLSQRGGGGARADAGQSGVTALRHHTVTVGIDDAYGLVWRRGEGRMRKRTTIAALGAFLATLGAGALADEAPKPPPGLERIHHIIVLYLENRSFDQLYGLFPGADGLAEAGAAATQVDRDGKPYDKLPPALDTNLKGSPVDARFPLALDNKPYRAEAYSAAQRDDRRSRAQVLSGAVADRRRQDGQVRRLVQRRRAGDEHL